MAVRERTPKSLKQKLSDLEAHLFLLRTNLHQLHYSPTHLKVISAELRTLVCRSSGTEGLLWRLTKELGIDDGVALHLPGKLIQDHPLVQGLEFMIVPLYRTGKGDPRLVPGTYSLRNVIKEGEALIALGKPITHEYLIKAIAQQMGTSHEDEGLEPVLTQLSSIFLNGVEPFVSVLAFDAEMTLEVGERVIEAAEAKLLLSRLQHSPDYGNVSIVLRMQQKQSLVSRVPLFCWHSPITCATIQVFADRESIVFEVAKRGAMVGNYRVLYPADVDIEQDLVVAFSYCSMTHEVRTITPAGASSRMRCDLGWLHAAELVFDDLSEAHKHIIETRFILTYERLVSTQEVNEIAMLPSDGRGLFLYDDDEVSESPFPD